MDGIREGVLWKAKLNKLVMVALKIGVLSQHGEGARLRKTELFPNGTVGDAVFLHEAS